MRQFSDAADPIVVAVGEEFVVRLASTPTTGYRWVVTDPRPDGGIVQVLDESFEAPASAQPGAAGTQAFRLRAAGAGSTGVGLRRARAWGSDSGAAPEIVFGVTVR